MSQNLLEMLYEIRVTVDEHLQCMTKAVSRMESLSPFSKKMEEYVADANKRREEERDIFLQKYGRVIQEGDN